MVHIYDPHLSALEVRFSRRCAIQIDVYLYLYTVWRRDFDLLTFKVHSVCHLWKYFSDVYFFSHLTNYCPSVLDTVGWVIWPVKIVPDMTYNVFGGTLNLTVPLVIWPVWGWIAAMQWHVLIPVECTVITSANKVGGIVIIAVCLSVCLSVCTQDI